MEYYYFTYQCAPFVQFYQKMMIIHKHRSSSMAYHPFKDHSNHHSQVKPHRYHEKHQKHSQKRNQKFQIRHLSSLLSDPFNLQKQIEKNKKIISNHLTKELMKPRKKQFKIRRRQVSIGKMICEENFAYYDCMKRSKEPQTIRSIGNGKQESRDDSNQSCLARIHTEKYDHKLLSTNQKNKNFEQKALKSIELLPKTKLEPLKIREKINQKRYKDLSARQLIYDQQWEDEVHQKVNTSLQKAIDRLLNRNRAATEGSVDVSNKINRKK